MTQEYEIKTVDAANIDRSGFFCYMSKPKAPGYRQKRDWLEARFAEGLKIKIVHEYGGRIAGFIEYIPGEYAWRAVYAPDYTVIHCLFVVGSGKKKGYGRQLIGEAVADARAQGKRGVVMVASSGNWLADKKPFLFNGFEEIDQAPPSFQLLVHRLDGGSHLPAFPVDWQARLERLGSGLSIVRTAQCPYFDSVSQGMFEYARRRGLTARVVELTSAEDVRAHSPTAYGTFALVLDGQLVSYHYLKDRQLERRFDALLTEG
ncbi:MAG: GNAT family N-acetyltransferase [Chloroflexota bacterium]